MAYDPRRFDTMKSIIDLRDKLDPHSYTRVSQMAVLKQFTPDSIDRLVTEILKLDSTDVITFLDPALKTKAGPMANLRYSNKSLEYARTITLLQAAIYMFKGENPNKNRRAWDELKRNGRSIYKNNSEPELRNIALRLQREFDQLVLTEKENIRKCFKICIRSTNYYAHSLSFNLIPERSK